MEKKQQGQIEGGRRSQSTLEREIFVTALPPVLNAQAATLNQTFNQLEMFVSQACVRSWRGGNGGSSRFPHGCLTSAIHVLKTALIRPWAFWSSFAYVSFSQQRVPPLSLMVTLFQVRICSCQPKGDVKRHPKANIPVKLSTFQTCSSAKSQISVFLDPLSYDPGNLFLIFGKSI